MIKNFKFTEAIKSDIAKENNIDNIPDDFEVINNIIYTAYCMQDIRKLLDCPVYVNSWFRCLELNKLLESKDDSQHLKGQAVDFTSKFGTPKEICEAILHSNIEYDQLILEPSWVHASFNIGKNRKEYIELI